MSAQAYQTVIESGLAKPGQSARCRFDCRFLFRVEECVADDGFDVETVIVTTGGLNSKTSDETAAFTANGHYPTMVPGGRFVVTAKNRLSEPTRLRVRLRGRAIW